MNRNIIFCSPDGVSLQPDKRGLGVMCLERMKKFSNNVAQVRVYNCYIDNNKSIIAYHYAINENEQNSIFYQLYMEIKCQFKNCYIQIR